MYEELSKQDKEICQRLIDLDKSKIMLMGLISAINEGLEIEQAEYELGTNNQLDGEITEYSLLILNNTFILTAYSSNGTETRSIIKPKGKRS